MPSLTDILSQEELIREINTSGNSFPRIDIQPGVLAIAHYGVILRYDTAAFAQNQELYVSRQLEAHQVYRRELNKEIERKQEEARELFALQQNRSWTAEMFSEELVRGVTRFFVAPTYWVFSFTTQEKELNRELEAERKKVEKYNFLKECFLYGAEIFDNLLPQGCGGNVGTAEIKGRNCVTTAREVAQLYPTLSLCTEKKASALQREIKFFFPSSS